MAKCLKTGTECEACRLFSNLEAAAQKIIEETGRSPRFCVSGYMVSGAVIPHGTPEIIIVSPRSDSPQPTVECTYGNKK